MAAGKPRNNYEEIRVKIEQAERKVLPAVELEKKEIRLKTSPEHKVPCIVMSTFDDTKSGNADGIVGFVIGPQGGKTSTNGISGVAPEELGPEMTIQTPSSPKLGSRLTVEEATSVMEKTGNLIDFFQDRGNSPGLTKSKAKVRVKKPRTPSPSSVRQSIGLDQLDTLVCLMGKLGSLRDENSRLKHRCDFLESTKTLLQAKTSLEEDDPFLAFDLLPTQRREKSQSQKSSHSDGGGIRKRPRLPSAEDAMHYELEHGDSSVDHLSRYSNKLHKRSFSTGSLEVPSDITEQSGEDDLGSQRLSESYDQVMKRVSKSPEIMKQKSKFSKWAKVKKVLTSGQQITDTIGSGIKNIKGKGASYFRYGVALNRDLSVPNVAESRSVDSGVGSGVEADLTDVRKSTSSGEPPSPTRFVERHIDVPTPQIDDDSLGIWLGPPEWIEKEREKELQLLKQALSESPKSESGDMGSPLSVSGFEEEGEKFLQVPIPRRQSSPVLGDDDDETGPAQLHRSSSYKEDDQSEKENLLHKAVSDKEKKKSTWGKMKHMMYTRKDSVQKTRRKGDIDLEESSEIDIEDITYDYLEGPVSRSTPKASPIVYRDKTRDKSSSQSPPGKTSELAERSPPASSGSIDVTALLGGVTDDFTRKLHEWDALRDKGKRSSGHFKDSPEFSEGASHDSAGAVSPEFLKKLEEWEKVKTLKGTSLSASDKKRDSQISQDADGDSSSDASADGMSTPPTDQGSHGLNINMEEMQRRLTDSFSRKMQEWEMQKYRSSQAGEKEAKTSVKTDRPKSKKSKEEKEKEKYEKLREREIFRLERQEQKLEREKIRLEKERLKSLEREAKIEKMKGRLSQPDMESKFKNPILGPLTEYKVTTDFARKLHEWEMKKGKDSSTAMYLEAQSRIFQFSTEYQNAAAMLRNNGELPDTSGIPADSTDTEGGQRKTSSESEEMFLLDEETKVEGERPGPGGHGRRPSPIKLIPCFDSPELSPGGLGMSDDSSLDDHTTATTESMTQSNIISLEKANFRLLDELHQKEREYNSLQADVRALSQQLAMFKAEHSMELEVYKQQVLEGEPLSPGTVLESHQLAGTLALIEEKIAGLQKFGVHLAMSMEGAAVGKFQTVEGEESINGRLVDLLDKMKGVLLQASGTGENTIEEVTRKSSALHNFEKLYSQAMQLQVQMNNLRVSQLERNKEILNMKRHLLVQEANNLRLQADVTRREAELLHYKEYSQKRTPIKRWNTYSGKEDRQQMVNGDESPHRQTVFQRVQRLRSARAPMSSTTDSDSDTPHQGVRKDRKTATDSPRLRKKESPRIKRRESPRLKKKESPKTKRTESPKTKRTESPRMIPCTIPEVSIPERSIERHEEYVRSRREMIRPVSRASTMQFTTVTLPTARVTLPKDISSQEINMVPKQEHKSGQSPKQKKSSPPGVKSHKESQAEKKSKDTPTEGAVTSKRNETKFPELLIPEWKKADKGTLHRMPSIEHDEPFESDDVFFECEKQTITEQIIRPQKAVIEQLVMPQKAKIEETSRQLDASFESSASEDTLKYLSAEASPAPNVDAPEFPKVVDVILRSNVRGKSMSDPGYSRQKYIITIPLEKPLSPILSHKQPVTQHTHGQGIKLNIPVIPLRRIKPAQELLEDSQKYRSGHSICLTRILKRYPMKIECRSRSMDQKGDVDSDLTSIKEGFVKTMVKQISREGTPDQKISSPLPEASSSPQVRRKDSKSEFVHHIVQQLSESCEQPPTSIPVTDLTNDGQVQRLKYAFNSGSTGSPDSIRKFSVSETDKGGYKSGMVTGQGSDEVLKSFESGSSTSTLTFSQLSTKSDIVDKPPDTNISANINYVSMPMLSLESDQEGRERSATTSGSSSQQYHYTQKESPSLRHKLVHIAVSMSPGRTRRIIDPTLSPPRLRRLMGPVSPARQRRILEPSPIDQVVMEDPRETNLAHSKPSQSEIKGVKLRSPKMKREELGTIGILCRQSLTFDLGVSQGIDESGIEAEPESSTSSYSIRHSISSTTSTSSQSEVDNTSRPGSTKEKKKSRHKFLDSSFIQKSKRFFKVSKENRCPCLECCGTDRELLTS